MAINLISTEISRMFQDLFILCLHFYLSWDIAHSLRETRLITDDNICLQTCESFAEMLVRRALSLLVSRNFCTKVIEVDFSLRLAYRFEVCSKTYFPADYRTKYGSSRGGKMCSPREIYWTWKMGLGVFLSKSDETVIYFLHTWLSLKTRTGYSLSVKKCFQFFGGRERKKWHLILLVIAGSHNQVLQFEWLKQLFLCSGGWGFQD